PHVLWGGLGMLVAIVLLLGFLSPGTRHLAAIVGGAGFGSFIDELGKFLTSDNDYFFKPTAALLYVLFVLLFFVVRQIRRYRVLTPTENLVNAIEIAERLAVGTIAVRSSRTRAYRLFDIAVLVALLLVQPFQFLDLGFAPTVDVIFDLLLLAILRYLDGLERTVSLRTLESESAMALAGVARGS